MLSLPFRRPITYTRPPATIEEEAPSPASIVQTGSPGQSWRGHPDTSVVVSLPDGPRQQGQSAAEARVATSSTCVRAGPAFNIKCQRRCNGNVRGRALDWVTCNILTGLDHLSLSMQCDTRNRSGIRGHLTADDNGGVWFRPWPLRVHWGGAAFYHTPETRVPRDRLWRKSVALWHRAEALRHRALPVASAPAFQHEHQ